jgi:hypothetical protein
MRENKKSSLHVGPAFPFYCTVQQLTYRRGREEAGRGRRVNIASAAKNTRIVQLLQLRWLPPFLLSKFFFFEAGLA